jgi:hypothetical protein
MHVLSRTRGDLFQLTVGHCSPKQTRGGWLVRNSGQEDVQVVLKEGKVPIFWRFLGCSLDRRQIKPEVY